MDLTTLRPIFKRTGRKIEDRPDLTAAAVLVPLFEKGGTPHILLTKRTDRVEQHKGQISFPGGAFDYRDMDCLTTALRETEEEIGLEMDSVEIWGELDDTITVTRFRICPYVGLIPYPYPFRLSSFEVERLIELPLDLLLEPARLQEGPFNWQGMTFMNYFIDYQGDTIWGATARILKNFVEVVRGEGAW
jgi:8-oxo-dGTP pyrophosphatase MutT (NUDIX family)